ELRGVVEASVGNDARRREVYEMGMTIAEAFKEEGRAEEAVRSRRTILLVQLETRFGEVPPRIRKRIENTDSVEELDAWIKAFAKARRLSQVGIPPLE